MIDGERGGIGPVGLREVRDADLPSIAALQARNGLVQDTAAGWRRLWRDNPVLADRGRFARGWVLEAPEGIVGFVGSIPLRGFFRGGALRLAAGHALVVQSGYRLHTGRLVSAFLQQEGVDICLTDSANEANSKILRLQKARPLPQPDYGITLFWILNRRRFLRSLARRLGLEGALASAGSLLGAWAMGIEAALRSRGPAKPGRKNRVDAVAPSAIDEDFESLWRRKLADTNSMIMDRSASALRWHFDVPGGQPVVLRCNRDGRLAGYVILLSHIDKSGLKRGFIADMLVDGDDPVVARQLLASGFDQAREGGCDVLELMGFPEAIRAICLEWKPHARRLPAPPYLFKAGDPALQSALSAASAWYATPYDGDWTLIPPA
jgi:hypothetical protein